jgi:hypothetical protein
MMISPSSISLLCKRCAKKKDMNAHEAPPLTAATPHIIRPDGKTIVICSDPGVTNMLSNVVLPPLSFVNGTISNGNMSSKTRTRKEKKKDLKRRKKEAGDGWVTPPLAEPSINPATGKSYRQEKRDSKNKERRRKTAREKKEEFRRNVKAGSVKKSGGMHEYQIGQR